MKKYIKILLIILIPTLLVVGLLLKRQYSNIKTLENVEYKNRNIAMDNQVPTSANTFNCPIDELRIDSLPKKVQENETAIKLIKDNCYWAIASFEDFNNDGEKEIKLIGVGYGCASCHATDLYIIDNDKIVFSYKGDDSSIEKAESGFLLKEPIRKPDEPYCCPSQSTVTKYDYSSTNDNYIKGNSIVIDNERR